MDKTTEAQEKLNQVMDMITEVQWYIREDCMFSEASKHEIGRLEVLKMDIKRLAYPKDED